MQDSEIYEWVKTFCSGNQGWVLRDLCRADQDVNSVGKNLIAELI